MANCAFKPTAEHGLPLFCCAWRGGGLTRRWTACKAVRFILRRQQHSPLASCGSSSCVAHRASPLRGPARWQSAHAEHLHASLGGRSAQAAPVLGASASASAIQVW